MDLRYFDPHRRATWLELFFDLIFVAALHGAGEILSEAHEGHIGAHQVMRFVMVFLPLWWIWAGHTIYANRFDTDSRQHRLSTLLIMFLLIVISAQSATGTQEHYALAVACYCGARLIISAMYFVSRRKHHDGGGFASTVGTVFAVGAAISLCSVLLEPPWRYPVFYAGIVFDMAALVLLRRRLHVVPAHAAHLVERVGLLTIIMLGESVISISAALAHIAWDRTNVIAAASGFVMVSAIWWIYYDNVRKLRQEQDVAGAAKQYDKAKDLGERIKGDEKKLEDATAAWKKRRGTSSSEVSVEDVAQIVSALTGVPLSELTSEDREKLLQLEDRLRERVVGQEEAVHAVSEAVRLARAGLGEAGRPTATFLFLGPTGVGKTELAKALAATVFGSEESLVRIDMSEYAERHTVARLVGAPPGYVGYEEGGQLTERVRRRPYSVVLLDEVEKAHPEVHNILLQLFDEGRLTDGKGRVSARILDDRKPSFAKAFFSRQEPLGLNTRTTAIAAKRTSATCVTARPCAEIERYLNRPA